MCLCVPFFQRSLHFLVRVFPFFFIYLFCLKHTISFSNFCLQKSHFYRNIKLLSLKRILITVIFTAKPGCDNPCMNGNCVGYNECSCLPGYKKGANPWICLPHCDFDCGYGYCSAPNKCTCTGGHMWMPNRNICD